MGKLACGLSISILRNRKSLSKLWSNRVEKKKDASRPIFPPELIIEILMYLPLKSLIQFQLVCKEWQALIQCHYFAKKLRQSAVVRYNNNVSASRVRPSRKKEFTYVQGCCDGLLLMRSLSSLKCLLWNPATRRVLELPDPHNHCCRVFAFSYVPSTGNYKIVSLYLDKGGYGFKVFTPGHSKAWRVLKFPDFVKANGPTKRYSVVSAGEFVHCMLVYEIGKDISEVMVISLDMGTESFTVTPPLPKGVFKDWQKVEALNWYGKLAIADVVGEDLELMVLEDYYNKKRWCGNKKIIYLPFMKKENYGGGDLFPLFARQGNIWFWLRGKKIITHTIGTESCTDIRQAKPFAHEHKLYPYKPSLVTFEGMQPETKFECLRNWRYRMV